jgi:hypothetical protein
MMLSGFREHSNNNSEVFYSRRKRLEMRRIEELRKGKPQGEHVRDWSKLIIG